jgi:hypothetical protein
MPIPWDLDLPIFALAIARVIFGRKSRASKLGFGIPVIPVFEEVTQDALTPSQREYLRPFDEQLAASGYQPDCDYRITNFRNLGNNLVRRYFNPTDPAACAVRILELKVKASDVEAVKTDSAVDFTTRFFDGRLLTTRNAPVQSALDSPPDRILLEFHQIASIADLKRIHDARASEMGPTVPAALGAKDVCQEQGAEHQGMSEFQLKCGNYELRPGSEFYELTDKTHLRGILNHFHPFGRRISWPTLAFSALVGSILPLFAILLVQPLMAQRFASLGKQAMWLLTITLISALYALAGLIIGKTSDWAPFHWIMLISYVPAHAIAGWSFGWFPYSTTMFICCFLAMQAKRRRKLIFEPQPG